MQPRHCAPEIAERWGQAIGPGRWDYAWACRSLKEAGPWGKGQTVDLETAIRAYTLQGAWANFQEKNRGSIEAGKFADLVVLSDDPFHVPPAQIPKMRVLLTVVGGEETHRSPEFAAPDPESLSL
jgi:predicted amidohydrolase YtcJ